MEEKKEKLQMAGSIILLVFGGATAGSVLRGEWSPWVWEELKRRSPTTLPDEIGGILWYAAFYALGFFMPYWLTTFFLFLRRHGAASGWDIPAMPANHRRGRLLLSFSTLLLFVVLLEPLLAFVRALPTEEWNGWLLILTLAVGGTLAYLAYRQFCSIIR